MEVIVEDDYRIIGAEYYIQGELPVWNVDLAVNLLTAQYLNEKIYNNENSDELLELLKNKKIYRDRLEYYRNIVVSCLTEKDVYYFAFNNEEIELYEVCFLRDNFLSEIKDIIDIDINLILRLISDRDCIIKNIVVNADNKLIKSTAARLNVKDKNSIKNDLKYKIKIYIRKEVKSKCCCWHDIMTNRIFEIYKDNKDIKFIKKSEKEKIKESGKKYDQSKHFTYDEISELVKYMYGILGIKDRIYDKNIEHCKGRDKTDCPKHGNSSAD